MLLRLEFNGSPHLGVFGLATEEFVFFPPTLSERLADEVVRAVDAKPVPTLVGGAGIVGSCISANATGVLIADFASDDEVGAIASATGLAVERLRGKFNAAGNNVLANDHGALCHADFRDKDVKRIGDALGVPARTGTIAGLKTVGSSAIVTPKGVLCHPKASEEELAVLEEVLGVPVDIGTVNHGSPYIGSGLIANAKGAVIGAHTTGPELNRIEDALGYI